MESKIFQPNSKNILKASKILQEGGIVVFPTETVYGIGANALNDKAIERIYAAKKRPQNNPLIVHVENLERARSIAHFSEIELFLAENFWPGPLTLVLNNGSQEGALCGISQCDTMRHVTMPHVICSIFNNSE